ncbi:MAG: cobyric acid synthase [Deltaproteobacteria bacterium]|nr:cobyric acid synthase [Deltaproteobacteria bacterium]
MQNFQHGGNLREYVQRTGLSKDQILDFSANINPLGAPEWLAPLINNSLAELPHYPDPECVELRKQCAEAYDVTPESVLVGNGSTELLYLIPRALEVKRAIIPSPSYIDYMAAVRQAGLETKVIPIRDADGFNLDLDLLNQELRGGEIVFVGHPNNPTGVSLDFERMCDLIASNPQTIFVIDEAFADLSEPIQSFSHKKFQNLVVFVSLTKTFAIPGLRLGIAIADPAYADLVRTLQTPWSVNSLAQKVGTAALKDREFVQRSKVYVKEQRIRLESDLSSIKGLTVFPSVANFLLVRIDRPDLDCHSLATQSLDQGVAIRACDNFNGLTNKYFRVAVRTSEENEILCTTLSSIISGRRRPSPERKVKSLMFQGTSSNAGKSVLTAAFCRIFLQDGFSVAPFKSQNMSLNSCVTFKQEEMGRAQVLQAQACRLEPDARMNPILLKPNSDTGSQVIVMGKPVANMNVEEYINYKPIAFEAARQAFDSLAKECDIVVIEGAGSPAEINLKSHDIVNMAVARHAGAPVLIVGDIDRGGVFASFVGTMELLAEWEKRLVLGFIVNRFRGREELLKPAIEFTELTTDRKIFGVVPFIDKLGLPEEDSVSFKSHGFGNTQPVESVVQIAIVDLPHISNFTDFDALRTEPDVSFRIVRTGEDIIDPDAIILPGSKNVIKDLEYLNSKGISDAIIRLSQKGKTEIVGICAGFQMIGDNITDPHGLESDLKSISGLGFLKIKTELALEKTLRRVNAKHLESGAVVFGYEIHHGQTTSKGAIEAILGEDGTPLGYMAPDGMTWGTYLHGVFDSDSFRRWFINRLRVRKGYDAIAKVVSSYDIEPSLDRLADIVRKSVRMDDIYRSLGL